jgi:hypothetical protein
MLSISSIKRTKRSFRDPYEDSKKFYLKYLTELLPVIAQMLDLEGAGVVEGSIN